MRVVALAILAALAIVAGPAAQGGDRLLARRPALGRTHVVFSYGGDLWSVPREGGAAVRLTAGPGIETSPAFSPDGSRIAITGEYDGNLDVFVMPASGGEPKRPTFHPAADTVQGWTPDGSRVLFASARTAYSWFSELFTVALAGGLPEKLPLVSCAASVACDPSRSPLAVVARVAPPSNTRSTLQSGIECSRRIAMGVANCPQRAVDGCAGVRSRPVLFFLDPACASVLCALSPQGASPFRRPPLRSGRAPERLTPPCRPSSL